MRALIIVSLLLCSVGNAGAQTFSVTMQGTITYSSGALGPSVTVGTPFTYSFVWDRAIPPVAGFGTQRSVWSSTSLARGATMTLGDVTLSPADYTPTPPDYYIDKRLANYQNNGKPDSVNFVSQGAKATGYAPAGGSQSFTYVASLVNLSRPIDLTDPGADWLDGFTGTEMDLDVGTGGIYAGTIQSVSGTGLTSTPEPSATEVFGSASICLAVLAATCRWGPCRTEVTDL